MKIQQENIREYPKIREIREHFLSWTIPVIRYLGMTVHWIDSNTLKRHKAAIACTQMMDCQMYDVLTTKI